MTEGPDVRSLVGDDLPPDELARLQRVHDLLRTAGPPPGLAPHLAGPPLAAAGRLVSLARRNGRVLGGLAAAAALVLAFGIGTLVAGNSSFSTKYSVPMHGINGSAATASIAVGALDAQGNWPLLLTAHGLPHLDRGWYELYLTRKGEPQLTCGRFNAGPSAISLSVPYRFRDSDGWIIVAEVPGHPDRVLVST